MNGIVADSMPDRKQLLEEAGAVEFADPVLHGAGHRQLIDHPFVHFQAHADVRMGEGMHQKKLADMRQLGLLRAQEFAACRHIEEKVADLNPGADRTADIVDAQKFAAGDLDLGAG